MRILTASWMSLTVFVATAQQDGIQVTRAGAGVSTPAPAEHFTGNAQIDTQFQANGLARIRGGARVTFAPVARTAWHTHPMGQLLIVTVGVGRVQRWGDAAQEIRLGDVVWIPPGQKHWHGAAPNSSMTHFAVSEQLDGKTVDWMEKVSDEQYGGAPPARARPSQQTMGDFAPKLAQITDDVLYADIWERQELSKRDRSLTTVSALIAMNRPDQLRSHFRRARENGVTQEELIETITHLAFYTGWPNADTGSESPARFSRRSEDKLGALTQRDQATRLSTVMSD